MLQNDATVCVLGYRIANERGGSMSDCRTLARSMATAVGAATPVQAHSFALELGVKLDPMAGGDARLQGDTISFDATAMFDEQEGVVIELLAVWVARKDSACEVTREDILEMLDEWLGSTADDDAAATAS